jgi:3-oxoacyl-[acyl-carrier protein] reductase
MNTGLQGKVVLITGASQGMGRATAEAFAREGARIAICARNEGTLSQAAEEIQRSTGKQVLYRAVDVTDFDAVQKFSIEVARTYGRLDVCVANAGGPPARNFANSSIDDWRKSFELNFLSVVYLAKQVIPQMQQNRWGRFITITSTSVRQPIPDLILSSAIRPAVVGLVKSLALEFGKDNITFNNVAPGYTLTERLSELAGSRAKASSVSETEIYDRWAAEVPLRRLGKPEEIADAIVWLASDRAAYVTGQTLVVDGGIYKGL